MKTTALEQIKLRLAGVAAELKAIQADLYRQPKTEEATLAMTHARWALNNAMAEVEAARELNEQ
jgi:hypothetical protein